MRKLAGLVVTTFAVLGTLVPLSATGAPKPRGKSHDKHDCRQTGPKGGEVCETVSATEHLPKPAKGRTIVR